MKVKKFKDPLFGVDVTFVWDCSSGEFTDFLTKKRIAGDTNFSNECGAALEVKDDKENLHSYYLWVEKDNDYVTLTHEIIHLVKHIFERFHVPFRAENDETIAYYHSYWTRLFWHEMGKKK